MLRKFIIMALVMLMTLPALGQSADTYVNYAPKKGDVQVGVLIGPSTYFLGDHNYYLLPQADENGVISEVGVTGDQMRTYFNLGSLNSNTVTNMIGVNFSWFALDQLEFTAMFGMNINYTPKKDFIEGEYIVPDMPIPSYQYVLGETNHLFNVEVGLNYRFITGNERISPYIGAFCGYQMARVEAMYPYTGELSSEGDPIELVRNSYRAGQAYSIRSGIMAGVDYAVAPGLIIGLEVAPASYHYSVIDIHHIGYQAFQTDNHHIKIFSQPRLKLGFRF